MASRRPSLPPLPDLSHLTEEERQIIEGVLLRQKEEEEKNCEIVKNLEKEVKQYEKELDQKNAKLSTVVVESILPNTHNDNQDAGPTCELCCKTKFVDGLGNPCHYCKRKTCARCGGKVNMKPTKFVWACRLCKKKQELLAKTGQWYHGTQANPVGIDIDIIDINQSSSHSGSQNSMANFSNQKSFDHPELQRSFSKELTRQYSLSEVQSAQRSIPSSNSTQHQLDIQKPNPNHSTDQNLPRQGHKRLPSIPPRSSDYGSGSPMSLPGNEMYRHGRMRAGPEEEYITYNQPYQPEEFDNQRYAKVSESKSVHSDHNREQRSNDFRRSVDQLYDQSYPTNVYNERRRMPTQPDSPQLDNYRYYEYSNSNENIPPKVPPRPVRSSHSGSQRQLPRITPEMIKGNQQQSHSRSQANHRPMQYPTHSCSPPVRVQSSPRGSRYSPVDNHDMNYRSQQYSHQTSRQKARPDFRNDSFSSDVASEPNVIRRPNYRNTDVDNYDGYSPRTDSGDPPRFSHQNSYSSSEEDVPISVDCISCEDRDQDVDSISDREYRVKPRPYPVRHQVVQPNYSNKPPVSWKLSHDKRKLIGHMVLQKARLENATPTTGNGSAILGLKIIGGKVTQSGRLGAFITKVKRGSIADVIGNLKTGDEVLEWNGKSFKNITYEEVDDIILDSKFDPEVELIVRRNLEISPNTVASDNIKPYSRTSDDGVPRVQLKLFYSKANKQLSVTLTQAVNLRPSLLKPISSLCSSFAKIELLPDKSEQNYRRTRLFQNSNNPRWNQTFVFSSFKISEYKDLDLEVVIFDYIHETDESDIIGEVLIDLGRANLQDIACWYPLSLNISDEESDCEDLSSEATHESQADPNNEYSDNPDYDDRAYWDNTPVNVNDSYYSDEFPKRNDKIENSKFRLQYPSQAPTFEGGPHVSISKPINHTPHYQDLKYDNRFPISEDIASSTSANSMRRSSDKSKEIGNDLLSSYCEEGPRRMNEKRYTDNQSRSKDNPQSYPRDVRPRKPYDETEDSKSAPLDDIVSESSERSENSKNSLPSNQSEYVRKPSLKMPEDDPPPRSDPPNPDRESVIDEPTTHEPTPGRSQSGRKASADKTSAQLEEVTSDSGLKDVRTTESSVVHEASGRKRRPSIGKKFSTVLGFNRKSSSTNNLDKKPRSSFQRSEEVIPAHIRDEKKLSMASNRNEDGGGDFDNASNSLNKPGGERTSRKDGGAITEKAKNSVSERNESHVETFVEGLGPGQLVGRQVLGMPCMGEIQLSFMDRKGHLEVEVIRARNLVPKNNSKLLPQPYIKLHLLEGKMSVEKQRTTVSSRKTLDPLYQQPILFSSHYKHKILQVSVWGEHGRMEKKSFMGMCDILLDDLKLTSIVFGWYKLFGMTASNVQHHQKTGPNSSD